MYLVTESGRVLADSRFLNGERYIEVSEYPEAPYIEGKSGFVCGVDFEKGEVLFDYVDIPPEPMPIPEPTQLDRIEEAILQTTTELRQEGADAVTLELLERGIL